MSYICHAQIFENAENVPRKTLPAFFLLEKEFL